MTFSSGDKMAIYAMRLDNPNFDIYDFIDACINEASSYKKFNDMEELNSYIKLHYFDKDDSFLRPRFLRSDDKYMHLFVVDTLNTTNGIYHISPIYEIKGIELSLIKSEY